MTLRLNFNLKFEDLYSVSGLNKLDSAFLAYLEGVDSALVNELARGREDTGLDNFSSEFLLKLAPLVEDFIAELFYVSSEVNGLASLYNELALVLKCKRQFIQRQVAKDFKDPESLNCKDVEGSYAKLSEYGVNLDSELEFAQGILNLLESGDDELIEAAKVYCAHILHGNIRVNFPALFNLPRKLDFNSLLVDCEAAEGKYSYKGEVHTRDGFALNDPGVTHIKALDNAKYCIHCHVRGKDSCSHGLKGKATEEFIENPLGVTLHGCPLDEKISEMNYLKSQGSVVGALAVAMADNPLLAATGHRICNDCMKSCIYQKQEPVDIPAIETRALEDVLNLSYGFEIYSLLSRWNPLKAKSWLPKPLSEVSVLVAGLGPAGFTMAHYLLNEGLTVVGVDGLKIEPLESELSGITISGERTAFKPIKDISALRVDLKQRVAQGFGGVAEYGITSRWDKNYLTIVRLLLERRANFRMFGGVRFGGTITYETAKSLGFNHVVLALGAGSPNLPKVENLMARGVRTASDFLMSLQLTGAARENSLANLQVRLPIAVIGAGLTAVDTAAESLEYYAVQVEKFLKTYEYIGEALFERMTEEEKELADEFLTHAKALRANPDKKTQLLREWGGSTIVYRKSIQESPSYRLNHEELQKALEEGVSFLENITPLAIKTNEYGSCTGIVHKDGVIEAHTVFVATGTKPNTVLAREDKNNYTKSSNGYFNLVDNDGGIASLPAHIKAGGKQFIHKVGMEGQPGVSFIGDLHPLYAGNVVKAMASAKHSYRLVASEATKAFGGSGNKHLDREELFAQLTEMFNAIVKQVNRLTPNIVEIVLKAPAAALQFEPGQFYRLQNFESSAQKLHNRSLAMEGLALTGAWVDKKQGIISTIVLEMGGSSSLCAKLYPGEHVVLAGPTGAPTEIPKNETVMLVGGGLGNAVLFSIGQAMRLNGCEVLYFAGYKKLEDRYKVEELQKAGDAIVWCCDEGRLPKYREQDFSYQANIVEAMKKYQLQDDAKIKLKDVDRMVVIGSDKMMAAVAYARHHELKDCFKGKHIAIGSINSPMQCMMKEICAQCLQRHVDPQSGEVSYVYSCFNQDQFLDCVDFQNLHDRLGQNSVHEKATSAWIARNL